jgi:hypothetical protein
MQRDVREALFEPAMRGMTARCCTSAILELCTIEADTEFMRSVTPFSRPGPISAASGGSATTVRSLGGLQTQPMPGQIGQFINCPASSFRA